MIALVHQHAAQGRPWVLVILIGAFLALWTHSLYVRSMRLPRSHDRRRAAVAVLILSLLSTVLILGGWYKDEQQRTLEGHHALLGGDEDVQAREHAAAR